MKTEQREKEISDSRLIAERGYRADRFLNDRFWIEDLEPALARIQQDAIDQKGWVPGSIASVDEVALRNSYFSGVDSACGEMLRRMRRMVQDGVEAQKFIDEALAK